MKPALLAGLPSTGTDWFADTLVQANPHVRYAREFFSPICNWQEARELETVLGDTLYASVPNLARPLTEERLDSLLVRTWNRYTYDFTKEVYLPFQLDVFARRFEVFVLARTFATTFPPNRRRVLRWYDAMFWSLPQNGRLPPGIVDEVAGDPAKRAACTHYFFTKALVDAAQVHDLPLFWHHDLMQWQEDQMGAAVAQLPPIFDRGATVVALMRTRSAPSRDMEHWEQWQAAFKYHKTLTERFGPEVR